MANEDRLKLFKAINKAGYDIGSYDDFDKRMNNADDRQKFYTAVNEAGYDIGSQEDFERRISPSKYSVKVGDRDIPLSEREYKDFLKRHPNGSSSPAPKPRQTPAGGAAFGLPEGMAYSDEVERRHNSPSNVAGSYKDRAQISSEVQSEGLPAYRQGAKQPVSTPWGTEGSATGKGRPYKPTAPGQVRTTEQPAGASYQTPYRPDLTAAQRDEIERQNSFAVKQNQKLFDDFRQEEERRAKPLVDTGNEKVNRSVIKPQGQWDDELAKSVQELSGVVSPMVSDAMKKADDTWWKIMEQSAQVPRQEGMEMSDLRRANEATDPDKILQGLQESLKSVYDTPEMKSEIEKRANALGIPKDIYLQDVVAPALQQRLDAEFANSQIAQRLPKNTAEYILQGLNNSVIGMLGVTATQTGAQRRYANEAAAMTEEGLNPHYTPGTGARLAQMGVTFAADAPFFGLYGKIGGHVVKRVAEQQIQNLMAKGLSEGAARSIVGSALQNSAGARMRQYIMQHVGSGAITMGGFNATSEAVRQGRDKEFDPLKLAGATAEGIATGAAFGVTGGTSQALSQPLKGFAKVGAKVAGFGAEAETLYATEELSKLVQGEEAFTNPFEGSVEALMKLGVMKASSGHLLTSAAEKIVRAKEVGAGQVAAETLANMLGEGRTGVKFTKEEQDYIRNSVEGQSLVESLANMHPEVATTEVKGKRQFTKEGEQMRQQLAENYNRFMGNKDIPASVKQKVAGMLGGIYRPGLETGVDIVQNEDGTTMVKTRDKDGNCVQDLKFDTYDEAKEWQSRFTSQLRRNDAVNMWDAATDEQRQNIVNIVRDQISGTSAIESQLSRANGARQKRMQRELDKLNELRSHYEGRELTDEEAREYIQTVIRDGGDEVFNELYDTIREQTYPADELNTQRNHWEGTQMSPMERHYAIVAEQVARERLEQYGQDFADDVMNAADYPDEKMVELATDPTVSGPMLEAALDYFNKHAKVQGMMEGAAKSIDEQVEAANAAVRKNIHTDSGALITGTFDNNNYYITAGHFEVTPDGKLVPTDNSGAIIVRDVNTGEIKVLRPEDITVTAINDPRQIMAQNESMDGLYGQLVKQADDSIELNPETPAEPVNEDFFVGNDGKRYMSMQMPDKTGNPVWMKIEVDEQGNPVGEPTPLDIDEYHKAKSDEIDAAERPQEEAILQENTATGEPAVVPEAEEVVEQPAQQGVILDNAGGKAGPEQTSGNEQPATPPSRIPVDEKGRQLFEQAAPEDTMAELTGKYGEERARQMIITLAENIARKIGELQQKDVSGITDMDELDAHEREIKALQDKLDYWQNLLKMTEAKEGPVVEPEPVAEPEPISAPEPVAELDQEGKPFINASNGTTTFGIIDSSKNLDEAPIKLSKGDKNHGLEHMEFRHGDQIRNQGFKSVEDFVEFVANNYTVIKEGVDEGGNPNGTYLLQAIDSHNNTVYIELSKDGSYWNVNSGGVFRKDYGNKLKTVWSASEVQNEESAPDNTLRSTSNADKTIEPNGTVSDTVSEGKDTKNNDTIQENQEKNNEGKVENPVEGQKKAKIYQKTVEANIGRNFTFTNSNGVSSVLKLQRIDRDGNAVVTRQDFDAQGNAIGELREERYPFQKVADAIIKGTWKKQLTTDEELRQAYKYHTRKIGNIPIIDVLTDHEKQQMLDALRRSDIEAAGNMENEFMNQHKDDLILRGRDIRNSSLEKAFARNSRADRLRGVREQYKNFDNAIVYLSDEAMQPKSLEEYIADILGDVPKPGKGVLAYSSYGEGDNRITGLQDETGFGSRGFGGDTKGFNPWLAPKGKGMSLIRFAENIRSQMPELIQEQHDVQEVRNALWNILTGAEKPTDITNMILRNRVEQAEKEARYEEDRWMDAPDYQKVTSQNSFANRLQRAKDEVNTEPTEGQKKAGNYKKGHISFGGYDFTIENPKGSMRRGVDEQKRPWEQKMNNTYGYILGKKGKDGDHLDFFINDDADLDNWNGNVYVVDQVNPDGSFNEHKILYGFDSEAEAREAYLSNYAKGWKGLGRITGVDKATFDKWLDASDYKIKDFADYSIVKHKVEQQMKNFEAAMKELNTRGISIDNKALLDKYGLKNVTLSKNGDHLTLTHFIVDQQGQGYGSRFMEDLARLADEKGWTLALTPGLGFGAKSKKRLTDFYKRFGFVPNKGRNVDFETREAMIRRPKEFLESPEKQEQAIRDAVVEHLRKAGIEVSDDWKLGQRILDDYNRRTSAGEVTDDDVKPMKQQKADKPMFFRTKDGQAYGYTYQGKIYLDPRIATSETPIHEYGHLWAEMKRHTAPEEWDHIKGVMLGDKLVQPIIDKVKQEYPELAKEGKEDDFVEEVITQFSGKRGAERLREIANEVAKEKGGVFGKAEAVTAMQRLKNILNRFWEGVAQMMGWKYKNANQIADKILADMLDGVNPNEERVKAGRGRANRADRLKQRQLDTILKENPADDENMPGHTWIRTINDIKTFREAVDEDGYAAEEGVTPDFTADMVKDALEKGVVTVYSSKPIKDGNFVTPSKMEATNYAGGGKVYSKEVPLTDVAWIDPLQGQYAKVSDNIKPLGDAPKYQLVGRKGAEKADEAEGTTMRQDNMKVAEEMEKAGKDIRAIKLATGWERGKDGQWRYETVDADVDVLTPYEKKLQEMKDEGAENPMPILKLQELLGKDNELFKYYPQMRNVQVMFDPTVESGIAGSTDGKTIELNANETSRFGDKKLDNENVYGILLHEVQHVIQEKEGFAQGGSLSTATTEAGMEAIMNKKEAERKRVMKEIEMNQKILNSGDELKDYAELEGRTVKDFKESLNNRLDELAAKYDNLTAQIDRIYKLKTVAKSDARDLYRSLAGEVEARNVTERMGMSDTERRNNPAAKTEDVPRDEQVFINGNTGGSASMGDGSDTFVERQKRAEREKGVVRPGLADKSVEILPVEKHKYTGNIADATEQAKRAAKKKYAPNGKPIVQHYDNYGQKFDYIISGRAINEGLNPKQQAKSDNKGAHLSLAEHLDEIIGKSIEVEEHPDYLKNNNGERDGNTVNPDALMHRFYGIVNIDGKPYRVMTLMREDRVPQNKDGLYAYEVQKIEVLNDETPSTPNGEDSTKPESLTYPLAKLLNKVEKSKDSGKYLLDESKKVQENEDNSLKFREGEAQQVELGAGQRKLTPKQMRERQAYAERQWRRAHEWANDTVEKLKIGDKVTIVDSIDELKDYKKFSARKKNAKGWYDPETDSIVIVMGNHRSPSDVVKTILHEAVAHHGLRKLFGGNYDTFLDNAYKSATFEIRDSIDELANKYDGDVRKATEEYMGKLAEDTEFENAENRPWVHHWFNQIKRAFLDMLKTLGLKDYKGVVGDISDNELRYILWRSYKNLTEPDAYRNVFQQVEDIAMRNKLAKEVKMPVKGRIEDEIPQMLRNHNDEIAIQKRVSQMSLQEAQEAYKRLDDMMRDEQGRDLDEQFEAHKLEYREKNGLDGIGKFMADDLKAAMDKYGSGMVELRWELADRIEQLGGSTVAGEGKELYRDGEDEAPRFQRVSNPEPEMTDEQRQYWKQWDAAMKKWKERNAIAADAEGPREKPVYQRGETAIEYAKKVSQYIRERNLWQTAPKLEDYRQVRDDKVAQDEARAHEKAYPDSESVKRWRVATELARLRHAMSRQKAYDKATVKAVTDFAQDFMKQGFGDNLRRGEMERLLSSVKNATGAKDIRKYVDNIMNILIDNQLRNLDQQVVKLSSVKELSKTAQGVEKQGRLELKGQRMIQAFRQARETRMNADKIRERIHSVVERMTAHPEETPMLEQEYEGLSIALQYQENIEASREEWADLDQLYKDAVDNYKTSGRSYKAQQELLESLDQAMMENKIERIGMFGDIIGRLQGNIAESMEGAKEFVEKEKERVRHIQSIANFDLAGKPADALREQQKGKSANFFLQPLATFEQMLKQFGSRNAKGEGHLYNYFMRNWMDATDKAYLGEKKAKEELDAKAREVFGDKVKRWSDLYDIVRKLPTMEVEMLDGENPRTFTLNQGNLLYIYMADKMNDGRMKLRKMGISEEDVAAIKEHLDNRLVQLADWLQDDYLVQKRIEYNKVHERMFGAPMASIDHYFPIKILGDARVQEEDVNVPDSETLPSTITGNIIKRTKNALPLDILHTDALSLAIEHIEDMERWAAQAEWNRDVNTLLSYTTFRNKVKNMDTIYGSGDALWNTFKNAAKMAAGTYRPSAKDGGADKAISNIAKGVTAAKINFRVYTAFKQILSAPAFLHDVRIDDFVKNSVNPYGSWKWAMENMPVFEKRWKSRQVGDTRLMDDPTDWKMWKTDIVQMATRMGMSPNALVDGVTCAVGARSIYESRYRKYKKIGASDELAHKRALQDAEIGYNLTQQSSEGAFVSQIQKDRTVAANMLSVFRNSSMAYTRQWVDAARNLKHRMQPGYKEDSIKFMTRQLQEQFDLSEDKAKQVAEAEYARAGRHEVAKMLNMMFGVTVAWNLGASLPYLLMGDDDETKKEMMTDALLRGLTAGPTEGFAAGNLWSEMMADGLSEKTRRTIKNEGWSAGLDAAWKQVGDYEINPLPFLADLQGMIKKLGYDKYAAAQDVFNICMQSAVGVNPQTFTDMWNACMDYGAPGWDGTKYSGDADNLTRPKEIALFIMRLMNAPTSSWRNKYIDELGMNAEDAQKLSYEEMARRYAHYKHWKDAPIMGWLRGEEGRQEKIGNIRGQFDNSVQERIDRLDDEKLRDNLLRSKSLEERRMLARAVAARLGLTGGEDAKKPQEQWQQNYQQLMEYEDIREDALLSAKKKEAAARGDARTVKAIGHLQDRIREKGKKKLGGDDDAALMDQIRQWRREALEKAVQAEPR